MLSMKPVDRPRPAELKDKIDSIYRTWFKPGRVETLSFITGAHGRPGWNLVPNRFFSVE